jgi:hypothetical protein
MFFPKTVVVLQMVPLVFESVEGFVFNLPPRSAASHDLISVFPGDDEISDPTEISGVVSFEFPVLKDVDSCLPSRKNNEQKPQDSKSISPIDGPHSNSSYSVKLHDRVWSPPMMKIGSRWLRI